MFVTHSTDDGLTWSEPREITADVKLHELDLVRHRAGQRHPDRARPAPGPPGHPLRPHRGRHQTLLLARHLFRRPRRDLAARRHDAPAPGQRVRGGGTGRRPADAQHAELRPREEEPPGRRQRRRRADVEGPAVRPRLIEPICQAAIERYRWPDGREPGRDPVQQSGQPSRPREHDRARQLRRRPDLAGVRVLHAGPQRLFGPGRARQRRRSPVCTRPGRTSPTSRSCSRPSPRTKRSGDGVAP